MSPQQTLSGGMTSDEYTHPSTLLWCDECESTVLRSQRHGHEHDGLQPVEAFREKVAKDKVPDEARVETQTYRVEYTYEVVEIVAVEADDKATAKRIADEKRDYNGEYMSTLYTKKRALGDPSPASIEWLEAMALLPEDHDVTPADLQRALEAEQ